MEKADVQSLLRQVSESRARWLKAQQAFNRDVEATMKRLIHEAVHAYMSADEVAELSGFTAKRVREMMRADGLDPKMGKRLLSKRASRALADNAALLGIEPKEMDLTSPLAYLPMGGELRQRLDEQRISRVTELPVEVSGNVIHAVNYVDHEVGCGVSGYDDPLLITDDINQITCPDCHKRLVRG